MHGHFKKKGHKGHKVVKIIGYTILGVFLAVIFALVFGFLVKALWNFVMPELFNLKTITYWQAFALVVLAKLFFGGFGSGPGGRPTKHPRHSKFPGHQKMHDTWHKKMRFEDFPDQAEMENFHEFMQNEEMWGDAVNDQHAKMKHFHTFWKEKGREVFEDYMKNINNDNQTDE